MADELVGQTIRGYELHEQIGEGGFGAVYRASQAVVGREVVIKIILPHFANQPEFIRRFEAEAQLVARLEHPYIVPLYDYWRDPSGAYLVMRYLRGGTLRTALEKGPYSVKGTVRLLGQMSAALMVAHRNGVIHRDVKPSNILLDDERNSYLTDFGIATQQVDSGQDSASGRVSGSAGYISPEQINLQPISGRTDMYAMGIILYEMLMGTHPFSGAKSAVALFIKHANEDLPPMFGIPEPLQKVIFKAAAKNPEDRYTDMFELANAFRQAAQDSDFVGLKNDNAQMEEFDSGSFELTPSSSTVVAINPYKGLRAFQESDANDFFGRESLTKKLLERLDEDHPLYRFLAVVGPSGSGKSSVVKAGVIPALKKGGLQNSENWFIVEMVPGISPFKEMAQALAGIATSQLPDIQEYVNNADNGGLNSLIKKILPVKNSELLLFIDQFEETFTQCEELERIQFLDALQEAITAQDSRLRVIVTLRADFYDRPLMVQNFSQLMQQRTEVVIPLTIDELERAITTPARQVKIFFQQGLAATIVSEVNEQPGVLPMLQYALTELFERREGSLLTTKSYQDIGGVLGALARRAEEIYKVVDPEKQEITRQLFLRLVTLGEGTEDTRRRALQSELYAASGSPKLMQEVIDTFGGYRLLTYDRDPITRTPTVEVAHEALIREWQRLRDWLDASRSDIRLQRMLASATKDWEDARRDSSFLLRGGRLVQFEDWIQTSTIAVGQKERDFLQVSIEERLSAEKAEVARIAREKAQEARAKRITRIFIGFLLVGFAIGLSLAIIAIRQSQVASVAASEANAARETAVLAQNDAVTQAAAANTAQSEAIIQAATATNALGEAIIQAVTATSALGQAQNEANANATAQQQAIEQADIAGTAQNEAVGLANTAVLAQQNAQQQAETSQSLALAAYADQQLNINSSLALALALEANNVPNASFQAQRVLLSIAYLAPRALYRNPRDVNDMAMSPNDPEHVYIANSDGTVSKWNFATQTIERTFGGNTQAVTSLDINPDGTILAGASNDNTIILWDIATGEPLRTLVGHISAVNSVVFSPDGRSLASGGRDSKVIIWDVATGVGNELLADGRNAVNSVAYSPLPRDVDGNIIANSSSRYLLVIADDAMRLWDFEDGEIISFEGSSPRMRSGVFSPDGEQIVVSGSIQSGAPQLWDMKSFTLIRALAPHNAPVNSVVFNADGRTVLSASDDFTLILSNTDSGREVRRFAAHTNRVTDGIFSVDGRYIFSSSSDGEVFQWDVAQSAEKRNISNTNPIGSSLDSAFYSPQSRYIISSFDDGFISVWDTEDNAITYTNNQNIPSDIRAFVPQAKLIFSPVASDDNLIMAWAAHEIRILNLTTNETLQTFTSEQERSFVNSVAFSPDGKYVAWGGGYFFRRVNVGEQRRDDFTRAGILTLWNTENGALIRTFVAHNVLDDAGEPLEGTNRAVTAVVFTPDGNNIISGAEDGTIYIWDVQTGERVGEFVGHADEITQIRFSKDGKTMLTASSDRAAILWDFAQRRLLSRFAGHTAGVNSVAFNGNESLILTGSQDSTMIVWDVVTGQSRQQLIGSDSPIVSAQFATDDQLVLSGSQDGTTSVWTRDTAERLKVWTTQNRYIPQFTCAQRLQFGLLACDSDGNTPVPTLTPTATTPATALEFTPLPTPSPSLTPLSPIASPTGG
jgi:WD40 repeat protein/serine/threonine protein kinase